VTIAARGSLAFHSPAPAGETQIQFANLQEHLHDPTQILLGRGGEISKAGGTREGRNQ
jgi:hypothetical protein